MIATSIRCSTYPFGILKVKFLISRHCPSIEYDPCRSPWAIIAMLAPRAREVAAAEPCSPSLQRVRIALPGERNTVMLLKNRVALVTGSSHNIGLGIARAFAREGAKVIVHSRHEEDAKTIAGEIRGDYFTADVAHHDQLAAMFDHIRKQHGRLDILINSVAHSANGGVLDVSLEEWNRIMTINLTGYFLCIQHAGKMMREQGGGTIINISAGSGERSSPGGAAY